MFDSLGNRENLDEMIESLSSRNLKQNTLKAVLAALPSRHALKLLHHLSHREDAPPYEELTDTGLHPLLNSWDAPFPWNPVLVGSSLHFPLPEASEEKKKAI